MTDIVNVLRADHDQLQQMVRQASIAGSRTDVRVKNAPLLLEALSMASFEIESLRSSLKEIREENDRLKGERDEARELVAEYRDHSQPYWQGRAEHAEASCEAMAKALKTIARDGRGFQCVTEDHKDGTKAFYKAAYHYYLQQVGWRISAAHAALAEYRKEKTP